MLTREIRIQASAATVYQCLTDPEKIVKWFGRKVDADPRIGGRLSAEVNDTATASGEFVELVPNEKVAFTFGWVQEHHEMSAGSSTVSFELVPDGKYTVVKFSHVGLPTEELVGKHGEGWDNYMPRLKELAETGDAGPHPFG